MRRGAALPCALLLLAACADPGVDDGEELDEGSAGKGDNASSTSTSEPLEIETLQRIACEAVAMNSAFPADADRRALMDRCTTLQFTVTSKTSSDLYQHAGSRQPVTLAMEIGISDTGADRVAHLFRVVFPAEWDDLPVRVDRALTTELGGLHATDPDFESATRGDRPLVVRRDQRDAGWVAPIDLHMTGGEVVPVRLYLSAGGARLAADPAGLID